MNINSDVIEIEIVGFTTNERLIFASLFKVSEMRTRAYHEWQVLPKSRPGCLLLDIDNAEARLRLDLESVRKSNTPIVTVGAESEKRPHVSAHIRRPIRWAGILHTLDTVFGDAAEPPLSGTQAEEFSNRVNRLEIDELQPWYDRSQPAREFSTDAAVLVVDPDPVVSGVIREELVNSGYRVDYAASAAQASDLVKARRYNCIVLEIDLPNGEGIGFCELVNRLSDPQRRTAMIILTANHKMADHMRASGANCDAYLSKPVNPRSLMTALEKFLPNWRKK